MIEVLPIKLLTDEDAPIFGSLSVTLGKLAQLGLPVGDGIVITPPHFKIKAVLEHFDFGVKETFEQSLTLVRKEINAIPVPELLIKEVGKNKVFLVAGEKIKSVKNLWQILLSLWTDGIKDRLWTGGFSPGITEYLEPKIVIFVNKTESIGEAFFDSLADDVIVNVKSGKPQPNELKKVVDLVILANKKLFIPHEYEWIIDRGVKIISIKPYTPSVVPESLSVIASQAKQSSKEDSKSAVKVFFEITKGYALERSDGIYIDSGKIFDLNKPKESFEDLAFKLVESAITFPESPVLFKLADLPEGAGKIRGTLRLIHQTSLFDPLTQVLDFARHKKGLTNISIVIPYLRGVSELLEIKRELATKKLMRKNSLGIWMEVCVPENIINIEGYIEAGIDGVVLNLDELIAGLGGFDPAEQELAFYKKEVSGLIKFLEDGLKLLHESKIPFIAYGNLTLNPKVLEFLVEIGVTGIVVENFEAHSAHDLLRQVEKRMMLRRAG